MIYDLSSLGHGASTREIEMARIKIKGDKGQEKMSPFPYFISCPFYQMLKEMSIFSINHIIFGVIALFVPHTSKRPLSLHFFSCGGDILRI